MTTSLTASLTAPRNAVSLANPWSLVPPLGNLDAYISAANRLPMLTLEEEQEFSRKFKNDNDLEAAGKLVLSHLRLVVSVSRQYLGYGLPHGDLIQEGNVGLMKAVKRFDPDQGVRLVSYAMHWIKAEIHEYILKNWRMVKVATTKAQRKLFFNLRSMKQGLESLKPKQIKEIASDLNVSEQDVVEMEARFNGHEVSLEPGSNDEDDNFSPISYLASASEDEPSRQLEQKQLETFKTKGLAHALESLDERSRRIIEARWLREGSTLTLHDLADEFGVSAERIRQIEQKAMAKMHSTLVSAG